MTRRRTPNEAWKESTRRASPAPREVQAKPPDEPALYEVLGRAQMAIQRFTWLVAEMEPEALAWVAAEKKDEDLIGGLIELGVQLGRPGDPLAAARARGAKARGDLLAEAGGALGTDQAAERLEMTRQGVNVRGRKGQLVRIPRGKGYVYPAAQFADEGGTLPGLEDVLRALGFNGWGALRFLLEANARLGGKTPLEILRRGREVGKVVGAAEAYGETGGAP